LSLLVQLYQIQSIRLEPVFAPTGNKRTC
jgi:hypothetical protein